ncbi:MAG: hypothetical protein EBT13_18235, partial [Rhodobacteraceae bacterium]|nr:hypothetical protein [Paracoccaceae bacterium]
MIRPADDKPLKGGLGGSAGKPLIPSPDASGAQPASPAVQIDPRTPGKDVRLLGAAVRRGWVVTDQMLAGIPVAMANLALRGEDERARVNAAKVLVEMHGQNEPAPAAAVQVNVNSTADT